MLKTKTICPYFNLSTFVIMDFIQRAMLILYTRVKYGYYLGR